MADDDWTDEEEGGDVQLEAQKAGVAFRAEMWATDFFIRNWMYIAGGLVLLLASVFIYTQYVSAARQAQLSGARDVAKLEIQLPSKVIQLPAQVSSGQVEDTSSLLDTARQLEALDVSGAARVEALTKAAELYRLAEDAEAQRRSLEAVVSEGIDPMAALAGIALANLDLEADKAGEATARLQELANREDYLGEQATLDLGMVYEHLGDTDKARATYLDFEGRYTESPRLEMVKKRREALGQQ